MWTPVKHRSILCYYINKYVKTFLLKVLSFGAADLDIHFDVDGPIKTSSPIEHNVVVKDVKKQGTEKKQITPPILMDSEEDVNEDTKAQKPQSNGVVTEG